MMRTVVVGLAFVLALTGPAAAEELAIIVHPMNPSASLDAKTVRALFLKTQPWSNGDRVRPIDHGSETRERAAFLAKVLGLTPLEFERYWAERQYSNGDLPPIKAMDEASVLNFVGTLKGTIAFVTKAAAERAKNGVKIVMTLEY